MKHRPPFRSRPQGFTLIEIMVVIAIMGLIMAMGMPSIIQAFKKEGMRKAVDEVQALCNEARSQAIFGNKTTWVYFYPGVQDRRYQLGGAPVAGTVTEAGEPAGGGGGSVGSGTLPDDVQIEMFDINQQDFAESPWGRVRFFPNGTCDELVLVLRYKEDTRKITLEYATGMSEVEEVHR